jgi:hypothetical protein
VEADKEEAHVAAAAAAASCRGRLACHQIRALPATGAGGADAGAPAAADDLAWPSSRAARHQRRRRRASVILDSSPAAASSAPTSSSSASAAVVAAASPAGRGRRLQYGTLPPATNASSSTPYRWRSDPTLLDVTYVADTAFQPSCDLLNVTFEAFADVTGVTGYAACVGTAPLTCDLVPAYLLTDGVRAASATAQMATVRPPAGTKTFPRGVSLFVTIQASSGAGAVSSSSTNGVICEDRAPSAAAAVVLDTGRHFMEPLVALGAGSAGNGGSASPVDVDCDSAEGGVGAAWSGFEFFVGLDHYEWAVGSGGGSGESRALDDILAWTNVGVATRIYNASISVPPGTAVFASVRAVDAAGRFATATSDGVLMLPAPPVGGSNNAIQVAAPAAGNSTAAGPAAAAPAARGSFVCYGSPALFKSNATVAPEGVAVLMKRGQ